MLQLIFVLICSRDASREIKYTMVSLVGAMDCDSTVLTFEHARMRVSQSKTFTYIELYQLCRK